MTEPATAAGPLAQTGVDTPGCDCGHEGMAWTWHVNCAWKRVTPRPTWDFDDTAPCRHCATRSADGPDGFCDDCR